MSLKINTQHTLNTHKPLAFVPPNFSGLGPTEFEPEPGPIGYATKRIKVVRGSWILSKQVTGVPRCLAVPAAACARVCTVKLKTRIRGKTPICVGGCETQRVRPKERVRPIGTHRAQTPICVGGCVYWPRPRERAEATCQGEEVRGAFHASSFMCVGSGEGVNSEVTAALALLTAPLRAYAMAVSIAVFRVASACLDCD